MKRILLFLFLCASLEAQTISTTAIDTATVGTAYSFTFTTTGGTAPRRVLKRYGNMPEGLYCNNNMIRGTAKKVESQTITFMVLDSAGLWTSKSLTLAVKAAATAPSVPSLSLPADGALSVSVDTLLAWSASTGSPTKYHVQLDTVNTFTGTLKLNDSTLTVTYDSTKTLANSDTYYWRVRAGNAVGWSAYSSTRSFTTVAASAGADSVIVLTVADTAVNSIQNISYAVNLNGGSNEYCIFAHHTYTTSCLLDSVTVDGTNGGKMDVLAIRPAAGDGYKNVIYGRKNVQSGVRTFTVHMRDGDRSVSGNIYVLELGNVDQSSPVSDSATVSLGSGLGTGSTTISNSQGDMVVSMALSYSGVEPSPTTGETVRAVGDRTSWGSVIGIRCGAGTESSWNWGSSANDRFVLSVVINKAP
jgi:hypothetical protein